MSSWQTIYRSPLENQVAIVRDVFQGEGLNAVPLDKKNHIHNIGDFEVRVSTEDVLRAIKLIQDEIDFS